jgi:Predicted permeases
MLETILDAFLDTIKMLPFMLIIFTVIEFLEHHFGEDFKPLLKGSRYIGPLLGAAVGILPQCGFSVMSSILYAEGTITIGTLISVYIATSDEAIPVILSNPGRADVVVPLLIFKFVIAITSGYVIDVLLGLFKKKQKVEQPKEINEDLYIDKGCSGHMCMDKDPKLGEILKHSLSHSFKVLLYVFIVSVILGLFNLYVGKETISKIFLHNSILQPILASFIGLIPNCATSVAITELFLNGQITFGSAISGLSSNGGLGLIVLFKEVKSRKKVVLVVSLLLIFSILSGIILNNTLPVNYLQH